MLGRVVARPLRARTRSALSSTASTAPRGAADDTTTVCLVELASACVDACRRGCDAIRRVEARRRRTGELRVTRKIPSEPCSALTDADLAAQAAIVDGLRARFPGLAIVAEEEEDDDDARPGAPPARVDLLRSAFPERPAPRARLDDVVVFVDPLDGTREFVEGRLANVRSLVGVAVNGRAVVGAVGAPFPGNVVHFGGAAVGGLGVYARDRRSGISRLRATLRKPAGRPRVTTGAHDAKSAVGRAVRALGAPAVVVGGAGAKLHAVVLGAADVGILHAKTSSWDTAAAEALIAHAGGRVTDYLGKPLVYSRGAGANEGGVVFSGPHAAHHHDGVCAELRSAPPGF